MSKSNTQKVREYRERLKADPEKWAAYRAKQSGYQRTCRQKGSVSTPVSTPRKPTPEERAALLAAFDDPVPLHEHPFIKALQERIPCTLVKELPQKEKPQ
jgi:hypothetical protein